MFRNIAVVFGACLVALPTYALAQDSAGIAAARADAAELRFERAAERVAQAISAGGLSLRETADAHRIAGEVNAALGRADRAKHHFARWLVLEPDGRLRRGVSPKISEPYRAARARVAGQGIIRLGVARTRSDRGLSVTATVSNDPLAMVKSFRVAYRVDGQQRKIVYSDLDEPVELPARRSARVKFIVQALDEHSNVVSELGGAAAPDRARAPVVAPPPDPAASSTSAPEPTDVAAPQQAPLVRASRSPGLHRRWYAWAGVGAVSAGVGIVFTRRYQASQDELDDIIANSSSFVYDDARAVERRAWRESIIAGVGYGVAGSALIVAVVQAVRGHDSGREGPQIAPTPVDGGASVTLGWQF